jgi:membrane protease subunit HflC
MKKLIIFVVSFILFFVVFSMVTYTVDETQAGIRIRFGRIMETHTEPGLYFKAPFVDQITYLDKRTQIYDINPDSILTTDRKRLEVDTYVLWRILEPRLFLESMKTQIAALARIDDIVYSNLRDAFAKLTIPDIISENRRGFLVEITQTADHILSPFGLLIQEVNVKRTDLPEVNAMAVFERMKTEREQEAALIRAEGEKEAQTIRAGADREASVILATAQRDAEEMRGIGEASALRIYAEVFSKDPEFYRFWRLMIAYQESFEKDLGILMSEDIPFLDAFFGK